MSFAEYTAKDICSCEFYMKYDIARTDNFCLSLFLSVLHSEAISRQNPKKLNFLLGRVLEGFNGVALSGPLLGLWRLGHGLGLGFGLVGRVHHARWMGEGARQRATAEEVVARGICVPFSENIGIDCNQFI